MRKTPALLLSLALMCAALAPLYPHGIARQAAAQTATANTATATDRLNLRSGPAVSYPVVLVIPLAATVELTGQESNGYRSVRFNGQTGWAFSTYLSIDAPAASPNTTATTTDRLNMRSGPGTSFGVVTVLPNQAIVTITGQSQNGFRSVTWGSFSGWVSTEYLRLSGTTPPPTIPAPETSAATTDSVNLRTTPSLASVVKRVLPPGTRLVITGKTSNGFYPVSVSGTTGWLSIDYVKLDAATEEPASIARTTDRLNLRSAPNTTAAVLAVIPAGATVTVMGQQSNGFQNVRFGTLNGWAFDAYLTTGSTVPPTPPPTPTTPVPAVPFDVTNSMVGPVRGSASEAIAFARRAGSKRMDEVTLYITEIYFRAPQIGLDPALLVAQSALETNYWRDDWWDLRLNPAGIGITGNPWQNNASPTFANGMIAARAQLAHMHAEVFGNRQPLPPVLQGVDPTYQRVFEAGWAGTIVTVDDLAGTWAVDPQYGIKIITRAREIFRLQA